MLFGVAQLEETVEVLMSVLIPPLYDMRPVTLELVFGVLVAVDPPIKETWFEVSVQRSPVVLKV